MCTIRQVVCVTLLVGCLWGAALGRPTIVSTTFRISGGEGTYLGRYGPIVSSTPIRDSVRGMAPAWLEGDLWEEVFSASAAGYCASPGGAWSPNPSAGVGVYTSTIGTELVSVGAYAAATYVFTCNRDRIYVDLAGELDNYWGGNVSEVSYSLTGPGVSDSYMWWTRSDEVTTIDKTLSYSIIAGGEYTLSLMARTYYDLHWGNISLCAAVTCIPAPGAVLLGAIGAGLVNSMRRRGILI